MNSSRCLPTSCVDAADSLSMLLALQGHETRVACSAKEALACVEAFRPEVGLLDIGLPGIDGYELAKRLRAGRWPPASTLTS